MWTHFLLNQSFFFYVNVFGFLGRLGVTEDFIPLKDSLKVYTNRQEAQDLMFVNL